MKEMEGSKIAWNEKYDANDARFRRLGLRSKRLILIR